MATNQPMPNKTVRCTACDNRFPVPADQTHSVCPKCGAPVITAFCGLINGKFA